MTLSARPASRSPSPQRSDQSPRIGTVGIDKVVNWKEKGRARQEKARAHENKVKRKRLEMDEEGGDLKRYKTSDIDPSSSPSLLFSSTPNSSPSPSDSSFATPNPSTSFPSTPLASSSSLSYSTASFPSVASPPSPTPGSSSSKVPNDSSLPAFASRSSGQGSTEPDLRARVEDIEDEDMLPGPPSTSTPSSDPTSSSHPLHPIPPPQSSQSPLFPVPANDAPSFNPNDMDRYADVMESIGGYVVEEGDIRDDPAERTDATEEDDSFASHAEKEMKESAGKPSRSLQELFEESERSEWHRQYHQLPRMVYQTTTERDEDRMIGMYERFLEMAKHDKRLKAQGSFRVEKGRIVLGPNRGNLDPRLVGDVVLRGGRVVQQFVWLFGVILTTNKKLARRIGKGGRISLKEILSFVASISIKEVGKKVGIYVISCSGQFYVGSTSSWFRIRISGHKNAKCEDLNREYGAARKRHEKWDDWAKDALLQLDEEYDGAPICAGLIYGLEIIVMILTSATNADIGGLNRNVTDIKTFIPFRILVTATWVRSFWLAVHETVTKGGRRLPVQSVSPDRVDAGDWTRWFRWYRFVLPIKISTAVAILRGYARQGATQKLRQTHPLLSKFWTNPQAAFRARLDDVATTPNDVGRCVQTEKQPITIVSAPPTLPALQQQHQSKERSMSVFRNRRKA